MKNIRFCWNLKGLEAVLEKAVNLEDGGKVTRYDCNTKFEIFSLRCARLHSKLTILDYIIKI